MSDKIDMSLDDIIKMEGISGGRRRGTGRRGGGPASGLSSGPARASAGAGGSNNFGRTSQNRGGPLRNRMNRGNRSAPYQRATRVPDKWQHDLYDGPSRSTGTGGGSTHLLVSNLDYGVNDNDIATLFSEFGNLRKAGVHYDKSGRSLGTADLIFMNRNSALAAMKKYNRILLDGRPMKIEMVEAVSNPSRRENTNTGNFRSQGSNSNQSKFGSSRGRGRGRGGSSAGARRGGLQRRTNITAEELDADLDAYVNK